MTKLNRILKRSSFIFGIVAILAVGVFTPISNQAQKNLFRIRFSIEVPQKSHQNVRKIAGWLQQNEFDIAGVNLDEGKIEVITNDEGLKQLEARGLRGKTQQILVAGLKQSQVDSRYYSPEKIEQKLKELNTQFPRLTQLLTIGKSLQGRPIYAIVISTTPNVDSPEFHQKPTVLFDAMHHAREIMTPEVAMDIAESLIKDSRKAPGRARETLTAMNVVVVPMLNVDGNSIVWASDNMWRKNARKENNNTFGVDINRNYPYRFSGCNGSSGSRGAQDYRGASGGSEPETQALMALAEKVRPMGSISYHSFSELVLYPFGCQGDYSGEKELIAKLGKEMADKLPTDSPLRSSHYRAGTAWEILYGVDGDSMSYMHAAHGAVAYVFEINQEFQPPYSLRDQTVRNQRAAWRHFLDQTQQHLLTIQVRDAQDRPVDAALNIVQVPHVKGERDFKTNMAGNYFKMLYPGVYTIETKSRFGKRASVQVNMTGQPQTVKITL